MTKRAGQKVMLLTVREVSQLLRIHRPKVYELIRAGTIEGFKLGSDWRIKRESVEALVGQIPDTFWNGLKSSVAEVEGDRHGAEAQ